MIIKYLGTAAAEGMPAIFCRCELCRRARESGGKDIRSRNQILIDGDLLVDFPMDSYMHALKYGLDLSAISDVFITHAHMDHCYPQDLIMRGEPFAHDMQKPIINVYGDSAVIKKFCEHTKDEIKPAAEESIKLHTLHPFDVVKTSSGKAVTALPAKHTEGEECLLYIVESGGKSALIMNDTGKLEDKVYDRIRDLGKRFDLVSFDCTYGALGHGSGRHMGLFDNIEEREKMTARGLVHENTKYVITHFSHNSGLPHNEIAEIAQKHGMTAAYDGMEIEI